MIAAILEKSPPLVSSLQPLIPAGISYVIETCLAKDPDDRWQTVREVKRELLRPARQRDAMPVPEKARGLRYAMAVLAVAILGLAIAHFRDPAREENLVRASILSHRASRLSPAPRPSLPMGVEWSSGRWPRMAGACCGSAHSTRSCRRSRWAAPKVRRSRSGRPTAGSWGSSPMEGKLKKIDVSSGTVLDVVRCPFRSGGTWSRIA